MMEKRTLSIKEFCQYMGLGETKARQLIKEGHGFALRIGNRWYIDKEKLDAWIRRSCE